MFPNDEMFCTRYIAGGTNRFNEPEGNFKTCCTKSTMVPDGSPWCGALPSVKVDQQSAKVNSQILFCSTEPRSSRSCGCVVEGQDQL